MVNVSATDEGAMNILNADESLVRKAVDEILDENSTLADPCAMFLSNISRPRANVEHVLDVLLSLEHSIDRLLTAFTRKQFNQKGMSLHYIGPIFSNLTQSVRGRDIVCEPEKHMLIRILPFTHHSDNLIRRGGATGILKNICFDPPRHDWLLSDEVNVLPFILLPLAGPEEYSDEDNDKFPIELQVSFRNFVSQFRLKIKWNSTLFSFWTPINKENRMRICVTCYWIACLSCVPPRRPVNT